MATTVAKKPAGAAVPSGLAELCRYLASSGRSIRGTIQDAKAASPIADLASVTESDNRAVASVTHEGRHATNTGSAGSNT